MGELFGAIAGVVLWTELWAWVCRKFGARPPMSVLLGAVGTMVAGVAITAFVTGESDILVDYAVGVPFWTAYRFWSLRRKELREQADQAANEQRRERSKPQRAGRTNPGARKQKREQPYRKNAERSEGPASADTETAPMQPRPQTEPVASELGGHEADCQSCGVTNESDASFCDRCGADLRRPVCGKCGTANRGGAVHCKRCGAPLRATPG